jgi:hypothetical protein
MLWVTYCVGGGGGGEVGRRARRRCRGGREDQGEPVVPLCVKSPWSRLSAVAGELLPPHDTKPPGTRSSSKVTSPHPPTELLRPWPTRAPRCPESPPRRDRRSDGTQYYGYPKTTITSDCHDHDGLRGIFGGFLDLFL